MKKKSHQLFSNIWVVLSHYKPFMLLLIHCILLILAWQSNTTSFLVFFAFIPVFYYLEHSPNEHNEKLKVYIFSFLAVFFWVYFTIYWVKPLSPEMHFVLTFLSSALLFIPYLLAFYIRFSMKRSSLVSILTFILVWIIIEIGHDLNLFLFPYLNLGHLLASYPALIQWYEWIGAIGGTIWIFLTGLSIYLLMSTIFKNKRNRIRILDFIHLAYFPMIVFIPALFSFYLKNEHSENDQTSYNAVCVHTNADVYAYKYIVEPDVLLNSYLKLTLSGIDTAQNNLIIWPENALTNEIYFSRLDSSFAIKKIKKEICSNSSNVLITGAIIREKVNKPDSNLYLPNILYDNVKACFYKHYNSALFIRSNGQTLIKTKKRLIPFGERIPPQKVFSHFVSLFPNLANLRFSSKNDNYPIFAVQHDSIRTNPIICYGSAFSNFVADELLKSQSNLLVLIMNEGWMKSTKAYNHFNWFAICRAIENQRQLIKSSNEGMSAIINSKGEIEKSIIGSTAGVLTGKVCINDDYSFYTKYHSFIQYGLLLIGGVFILFQFLIPGHKKHTPRIF